MQITTLQEETVDALAFRVFGDTTQTAAILELNPELKKYGAFLPGGVAVRLPTTAEPTAQVAKKELWQ